MAGERIVFKDERGLHDLSFDVTKVLQLCYES